ncbi:MAG: carboxypeptidase-like regulatory domain-containing protein, partial [Bacteroidota bacterium]
MKKRIIAIIAGICLCLGTYAQTQPDWTLKLTSNVEKDGKGLGGASITLYKGSTVVAQTQSGGNGDFEINVPPNGDYSLEVSYPGCNKKKFAISTMGVPPENTKDNFKAQVKIEGVTMSKPLPGINYSVLNQPLLRLVYLPGKKNFSDEPAYTSQALASLAGIRQQEADLLARYTAALKTGDGAFAKKDCETAKTNYTTARGLLPDEGEPVEKLAAAEKCLVEKAKEAEKAAADKAAAEAKAAADKLAKEQAAAQKAAEEKAAQEKIAADKAAADKAAQEKAAADKLEKEQAAAQKAAEEKAAQDKLAADKAAAAKAAEEKAAADKLAKEQAAAQKAAEEKAAQDKL